jgi:hypothetical protein
MRDGEDWLLAPVIHGLCKYESLLDGTLNLVDIARMNEAITVSNENQHRMVETMRRDASNGR